MSYADAVHRGFAELNIVSSVCAVLLFILHRYASPTRRSRLVHALEWVVVIQAQILLVSAFYRVNLYEAAYGFTRLRLYVQVYAAIAFVALCCLLVELRTEPVLDRLLRRTLGVRGSGIRKSHTRQFRRLDRPQESAAICPERPA